MQLKTFSDDLLTIRFYKAGYEIIIIKKNVKVENINVI